MVNEIPDQNPDDPGPPEFWVKAYRCHCGHEWVNRPLDRDVRPRVCPKCKVINWDRRPRPRPRRASSNRDSQGDSSC